MSDASHPTFGCSIVKDCCLITGSNGQSGGMLAMSGQDKRCSLLQECLLHRENKSVLGAWRVSA